MKQNLYLVAFYYAKPKTGVKTFKKGWMDNAANIQYDEAVEISRGLKKNVDRAKVVLNLTTKKVERNGWNPGDKNFDELFKYYFKGYHQYITAIMSKLDPEYFNKMLDEMQTEVDKLKAATAGITPEEVLPVDPANFESTTQVKNETISSS